MLTPTLKFVNFKHSNFNSLNIYILTTLNSLNDLLDSANGLGF